MRISLEWLEDVAFEVRSGSGHRIVLDGSPDHGGRDRGMRPMEAVLAGLGGCSAFDVVTILRKGRQAVTGCTVEIEADRADAVPAVFTRIHLHYVVSGQDLVESRVRRAIELSADRYCSVTEMLRPKVAITHDFEIRAPG